MTRCASHNGAGDYDCSAAHHTRGFSLIEVIVALVVFSSVFLALYRGIIGGGRAVQRANLEAEATRIAVSQLAAAGIVAPLVDGQSYTGEQDRYSWRISVQRYADPSEAEQFTLQRSRSGKANVSGYWVDAEVSWRAGGLARLDAIRLRTLKLGNAP